MVTLPRPDPIALLLAATFSWMTLVAGCEVSEVEIEDYPNVWLEYTPPAGWERHDLRPVVIEPPTMKTFVPTERDGESRLRVIVRDSTDLKSRQDRIGALYWRVCLRRQRNLRLDARRNGEPTPTSVCRKVAPSISGFEEVWAIYEEQPRNGEIEKRLVHFVRREDGRRFRIDYQGDAGEFDASREEVLASFSTLRFAARKPDPAPSREAKLDSLREQRDGERLWLYDGAAAGALLTNPDLELLQDPALAGVTSLNPFSGHAATLTGLEVSDAGLTHLAKLPLTFLCLRGTLVTDAGLAALAGMPLTALVLEHTLVQGEGLRHLAGMPLEILDLANTMVGDDALLHLRGLPLESLDLRNTAITDAGLDHLADLGLGSVIVVGTDVTEEGIRRLASAGTRYVMVPREIPKDALAQLREGFPGTEIAQ